MKSYGIEIIVEQKTIVVVVKWCRKIKKERYVRRAILHLNYGKQRAKEEGET